MDLYGKLLRRLDELSFGFPKSFLGMDRLFVKQIFTKEDARDFLMMAEGFQTPAMYAAKNNITEADASERLERMVSHGEIFRRHCKDNPDIYEYEQHPWAMGFMEWQVKNPKRNWLYTLSGYIISSRIGKRMSQTMPFYRTIPMHKEFVEGSVVAPYEDLDAIMARHTRFAVANCICRMLDDVKPNNPCKHPLETCIETDDYATFYIETGMGREITREEALAILRAGEKDGRVVNVSNSKDGENLCSCCECGCGMMYLKTHYPGPSKEKWSNYYVEIDHDKCVACGACTKKCTFGVLSKSEEGIHADLDKCLGCGLCVSSCKSGAIHLRQKENPYEPPEDYGEAMEIWGKITRKDYNRFK